MGQVPTRATEPGWGSGGVRNPRLLGQGGCSCRALNPGPEAVDGTYSDPSAQARWLCDKNSGGLGGELVSVILYPGLSIPVWFGGGVVRMHLAEKGGRLR